MESKEETDIKPPSLGYRHVMALIGFSACFLIQSTRLNLSVAILAMVNQTMVHILAGTNSTSTVCPLRYEINNSSSQKAEGKFLWNSQKQGLVIGIGYLGFALATIPASRIFAAFQARRVVLFGGILSTIATFLSPVASELHLNAMVAVQFVGGMGQGFLFVSLFVIMANWFPRGERGLLSTLIMSGNSVGSTAASAVTGYICDAPELGWPASFYIMGGFGVFHAILVILLLSETPQDHPKISPDELHYLSEEVEKNVSDKIPEIPWRGILTSVPFYALLIAVMGQYWGLSYFWTVHSTFLGTIQNFPIKENGVWSSLPFIMKASGEFSSGSMSNWLLKKEYVEIDALRRTCNSAACIGFSAGVLATYFSGCNGDMSAVSASVAMFFIGVGSAGSMITSLDMAPRFAGFLSAFSHGVGNFICFLLPMLVGAITKNRLLHEWHTIFFISIAFVMTSGIVFAIFGSAKVQPWNFGEEEVDEEVNAEEIKKENEISPES